jgi:predicted permease
VEEGINGSFEMLCYALLFCSILVLAVASANVFNLVMTRVATRTSELSIRNALGARRAHIVMQVIIDGLILTLLGALGGTLIAGWSLKLIWAKFSLQQHVPYWWHMDMDAKVLGFVVAIIVLSALASSLVPGLRASRTSVAENLKDDSRTSSGLFIGALSKVILGFQVTMTGVLAFVSVMMLLVWVHMKSRELIFDPTSILNAGVRFAQDAEDPSAALRTRVALRERLLSLPGVEAAAYSTIEGGGAIPDEGTWGIVLSQIEIEGEVYDRDEAKPRVVMQIISEGFDDVFGIQPILGRSFSRLDTMDAQLVCMVNKAFVDYYWPNEDPIGKRIKLLAGESENVFKTVVGILPNLRPKPMPGDDLVEKGYIKLYLPFSQREGDRGGNVLIRTSGDPHRLVEPMRRALRDLDPTLAFHSRILTLQELIDRNMVSMDLVFAMFGVFGASSLVLGVVGLYAIMSFTTRQRFREFGIRMALGATSKEIMITVVKRGSLLLLIGGVLGVGAGHAVSMVLKSTIDVHELPLGYTYPIVIAILTLATVLSMGIPAWRASRISPNQALRVD